MPRKYEMSWDGPPNYRWVKMFKGQRYRVTCEELGAMVWTKDATRQLANEWWRGELAKILSKGKPAPRTRVATLR
jgi:hypothetical protein